MQRSFPQPPHLALVTALIFTCALVAISLASWTNRPPYLIGGVLVTLFVICWRWLASRQDVVKGAALVLSIAIMLVTGRIVLPAEPGHWAVFFLLVGGSTFFSYLFIRFFLGSTVKYLWARSLPPYIETRDLEIWYVLLYVREPFTGDLIPRMAIEKLQKDDSAESARLLATAVTDHPRQPIRALALRALDQFMNRAAIDTICAVWAATRHPDLAELLIRRQWRASTPPELLTLSALLLGEVDLLRQSKPEWIRPLAKATRDVDPAIAERARQVLQGLRDIKAQEALWQFVIAEENPTLKAVALSAKYLPHNEQLWALFLFMTEQWEQYDALDFDRRLMHLTYIASPEPVRQRIRKKLRTAGRSDFLPIIAGESTEERASQFNADENEVLVQMLIDNRNWAALWPRVFDLPFRWSVHAIEALSQSGWKPADGEEQTLFAELAALSVEGMPVEPSELRELFPLAMMQATARVPGRINAVAFAPSRPAIAIGTGQGKVVLWNYQTAQRERLLQNFPHSIGEIAFLPNETLLCAEHTNGTETCSIYAFTNPWNNDMPFCLGTHTGSVTALAPVGNSQVVSAGTDKNVVVWDVSTQKATNRISLKSWARNLRVSSDGKSLLLLHQGLDLLTLPDLQRERSTGRKKVSRCAAFSPETGIVFVGTFSGKVSAYSSPQARRVLAERNPPLTQYSPPERVEAIEVLKQQSLLLSAGTGGEIRFFSIDGRQQVGNITVPNGQITSLNISPDESFMAVGSTAATLTFWDLRTSSIRSLLEQSFAQAQVATISTLRSMLDNPNLPPRTRRVLQFMWLIIRHRFRYTIEVEITETPSIAQGEFDIEID